MSWFLVKIDPVLVAKARDLVNEYDELINKMKIYKEKIRESPNLFTDLSSVLTSIYSKTRGIIDICSSVEQSSSSEYIRYLRIYCEYLVLISIPYVLELLNIMKNYGDENLRNSIEKFIKKFNELI